jgi:AcrR family transcriptional regulator
MRTKSEEKRQAILDAAAATFAELGFERASMSEICARLGGSKATLYSYFPSKESLFIEVMFQASDADFQNTMLALECIDGDVATALRRYGQRFLGLLYSPNVMAVRRLLVAEGNRAQLGQRCWDHGPRRGHAVLARFLEDSMAQGALRQAPTALMTAQLNALLEAELLDRFIFQHLPPPTPEELAACSERAIQSFLHLYGTAAPA